MCYRCREYGHAAASCPSNPATGNEVQEPTVTTATTSNTTARPTQGIDAPEGASTALGQATAAISNTVGTANRRTPEPAAETPTVSSTTPTNGLPFTGATVEISGAATDPEPPISTTQLGSASDP